MLTFEQAGVVNRVHEGKFGVAMNGEEHASHSATLSKVVAQRKSHFPGALPSNGKANTSQRTTAIPACSKVDVVDF